MLVSEQTSNRLIVLGGWRWKFKRGDAGANGTVQQQPDADMIFNWLFLGTDPPPCWDAADVNDDGKIDIADPDYLNDWFVGQGQPPPALGPNTCGFDTTIDLLGCRNYASADLPSCEIDP